MTPASPDPSRLATSGAPQREECVARLVEKRLRDASHGALAGITCEFHEGTITLCGSLPSYYLKQVAQSLARQTHGVRQIVNRIDVVGGRP